MTIAGIVHEMKRASTEPIAVIGMACRFPGAESVEGYWRLLIEGRDAVMEGEPGSGIGRIGKLFEHSDVQSEACKFGSYLDQVDLFDAAFFRISPVEAQFLDPQQRLMLETSWQALEDAAIDPESLIGSRTGVYGGISNNEYRGMIMDASDTSEPAASLYTVSGTSYNTAVGRVSYALGFRGPAIAIDTACSSSLVAIHQAVSGLQNDEADLALAGGVHTILSGRLLELRGNAGMLSPDGRCKTFDASANGYVRGEGCGMIVLKRLRDAETDGDRIWGVIRGSALNQDGASQGLTVPSAEAQRQVIEDALSRGGILASDIDYVEAHGTGTPVGDPVEIEAMGAAYGTGRELEKPLLVGSVKTNFGHLESAAGVAGVIKTVLALKHGVIPKHLHFKVPNPDIDWENLAIKVTAEMTEWPDVKGRNRLAGVSGFGWSGTNAHVILEGYGVAETDNNRLLGFHPNLGSATNVRAADAVDDDAVELGTKPRMQRSRRLLPLSGKTESAVKDLASSYLDWLDVGHSMTASDLADSAWTAGVGRSHFECRTGITFSESDVESLRNELNAVSVEGSVARSMSVPTVAFVYTGQGSQWVGMGETLYEREPVVRAVLDKCELAMLQERGLSLLDVMFGRSRSRGDLNDTAWTQPTVYALECALTALWASLGVEPDIVIGHSLGEFAAAQAAGVFSLDDGLRFVAKRGELLSSVPELGGMAAIFASSAEVLDAVRKHNSASGSSLLCVAVNNGVHQVVSGPVSDVETISKRFEDAEVRVRPLRNQAFHSELVEPALDELEDAYKSVNYSAPRLSLISNVTGRVFDADSKLDGSYWRRHARQSVEFQSGIETMADLGVDLVIEIGPNAVLGPLVSMAWPGMTTDGRPAQEPTVLASLLRNYDRLPAEEYDDGYMTAVAGAYESGLKIRFEGLFNGESRCRGALPSYPFQRERYWVDPPRRRRESSGHQLLGTRHESPRGEVLYETVMFPDDPSWLNDHRVFGRVIMPGSLYAAMAASVSASERMGEVEVADFQLHSAMVFSDTGTENDEENLGRSVQVLIEAEQDKPGKRLEIYSKGNGEDEWTLHVTGSLLPIVSARAEAPNVDLAMEKSRLRLADVSEFYAEKSRIGIEFGPTFRSVDALWCGDGEAIGEVVLAESLAGDALQAHPVLVDGCFQILSAARSLSSNVDGATYLPFGWERMWLRDALPDRVVCHVQMQESSQRVNKDDGDATVAETFTGDIRLYSVDGVELGRFDGYTVKRATRAALLAGAEEIDDLLYEVVWRDRALATGVDPADFLPSPENIALKSEPFTSYLANERVEAESRADLLNDLERLSWSFALSALEELGWHRIKGENVDVEELRQRCDARPEHSRVFRRMFELLTAAGIVQADGNGFLVSIDPNDALPELMPTDAEIFAQEMLDRYDHGSTEVGLFSRCARALPDVLRGEADPLTLLFSSGSPSAADLYLNAPVARAANRMLADAVADMLIDLPDDRILRVLEVGAGTGSATASVLPELPEGRYEYVYTDISAGFFAEAESRFGGADASIDYRVLDIEKSPVSQGFEAHAYDLVIASNVLHATQYLNETLENCLELLAPSGLLVALENLRGQGWLDLTFGQLDGWWRFADEYRPHHALASPDIWKTALSDAGFVGTTVLGPETSGVEQTPDRGVIVAQGPAEVTEPAGVWILASDTNGFAGELACALSAQNQHVMLASDNSHGDKPAEDYDSSIVRVFIDQDDMESWRRVIDALPTDLPVNGIVHLVGLDGHGEAATASEFADDIKRNAGSALALTQAILDADITPAKGLWFVTCGGQVLEHQRQGELTGAMLWGFGKVVDREASHLQTRMIDLDPSQMFSVDPLIEELLHPDEETHIAYRDGHRQAARLIRVDDVPERLKLPDVPLWLVEPDEDGALEQLEIAELRPQALAEYEVRVENLAAGLNFWDLFRSLGVIDEGLLGGEFCGRVIEIGSAVTTVSVSDLVVGLAFGTFGSQVVTHVDMVARAANNIPITGLATIPTAFASAQLSFDASGLNRGDRVLIHAGAGGVGMAAVQLAQAAGAEVFATASASKQNILHSFGVKHVFDSRNTDFGQAILDATNGEGVDIVINSLTGEGFIPASLSCLKQGGRFVELARVDILSNDQMSETRPDVSYKILELDVLKELYPAEPGDALRRVMSQFVQGGLKPITHTRWSMNEAGPGMKFMRAAKHIGKIVFANSPIENGQLRNDRTYLVTGGTGGIGIEIAQWLSEKGAGAIVLNGRRQPDPQAADAIEDLKRNGANIQIELADVTDTAAVDEMFARIDASLPPLGGVIHSVGVLSDASLMNQNWNSFERVLWPKTLGAWHLHCATLDRDLDMFVLFSSVAGVLGNAGQANHAAANAFLDQLAAHRRSRGLAGQAIAWGAWSDLGEAEEQRDRIAQQLEAVGTGWISPRQGIKAFETMVRQDFTNGVAAAVDWETLGNSREGSQILVSELMSDTKDIVDSQSEPIEDVLTRIKGKQAADREAILVDFLQEELQAVMRLPSVPATTVGFFDLGMDSLMAVELRNRLNRAFASQYSASNTVVFDYPNVADLARHLSDEMADIEEERQVFSIPISAVPEPVPELQRNEDGIAIVGMAGRFPGASDISEFWKILASGTCAITDGRRDGGSWQGTVGDPDTDDIAYRRGAFLDHIDLFDSRFFRISPIEARMMDPRQRMLLETSWEALEDAGIDPNSLRGSRTGIYSGIGGSEYRDLIEASGRADSYLGTTGSVTVGRVAFALGLEGTAMPVDVACASSLAAVHQAVVGLQREEVDMALAGGVNIALSPSVSRFMMDVGMLSPTGECKPFDASANGYVRGEGCGVVVLKRLSDAEADGDRIWGVIRGSAVNQNGASAGLTVPNGQAQERVMREALKQSGIAASEVDYLEAHATGSQLGDPIELNAAASVYGADRPVDNPLMVGSVKSNVGHVEWAAGVAALIKTVLSINHGLIPQHLHFDVPNPHIEWDDLPVRVASTQTQWPIKNGKPLVAGVNAFGMSGTNAHVLLEGYPESPQLNGAYMQMSHPVGRPKSIRGISTEVGAGSMDVEEDSIQRSVRLLPLSGTTVKALRDAANRFSDYIGSKIDEMSDDRLSDVAWTAGSGRSHFNHRAGVVFADHNELIAGLEATIARCDAVGEHDVTAARRAAFIYRNADVSRLDQAAMLYESEPTVRAVLDVCDTVTTEEFGFSIVEYVKSSSSTDASSPTVNWPLSTIYTVDCALTALWTSVGINPNVIFANGTGAFIAAWASGGVGLENGLRIAATVDKLVAFSDDEGSYQASWTALESIVNSIDWREPEIDLIDLSTGSKVGIDELSSAKYWSPPFEERVRSDALVKSLRASQIDVLLDFGCESDLDSATLSDWRSDGTRISSKVVPAIGQAANDCKERDASRQFVNSLAKVYETGFEIAWDGVFAGEKRRRVSLPLYPFQRRRHWI